MCLKIDVKMPIMYTTANAILPFEYMAQEQVLKCAFLATFPYNYINTPDNNSACK